MTPRERVAEIDPEIIMLPEEFDHALIGTTELPDGGDVVVYDEDAVIAYLATTMGESAREFFEFNIQNGHIFAGQLYVSKLVQA